MHSKIINPAIHGRTTYQNTGSCVRLVHYLAQEAKAAGKEPQFFNGKNSEVSAGQVQQRIDSNVKGLRKMEVKFYSLVLSPSEAELKHIGNDPAKLKDFTRQAMQNYAATFISDGKRIREADLVWFATIHQHRSYKGTDAEVKTGMAKAGEHKPGYQTHVHVIVSKRDAAQKISLNPQGSQERFSMKNWQRRNQQSFEQLFGYRALPAKERNRSTSPLPEAERLNGRVRQRLEQINGRLPPAERLSETAVLEIAQKRSYSNTFFLNLNRLETKLRSGHRVSEPLYLLEHNRHRKPEQHSLAHSMKEVLGKLSRMPGGGITGEEDLMPALRGRLRKPKVQRRQSSIGM